MPVLDLSGLPKQSSKPSFIPSPQQQAVYDWVKTGSGSALVVAVAGGAKTTTLKWVCEILTGSVAFAAYNKKIADEISYDLRARGSSVQARTFHSFGWSAWKKQAPNFQVDDQKMRDIVERQLGFNQELSGAVLKLVSLAKNHCVGVTRPIDDHSVWQELCDHYNVRAFDADDDSENEDYQLDMILLAIECLKISNAQCHTRIDFDDMLYAPLVHNARIWQNDWLLVDEAQDTNPARRLFARRMLKASGRAIFVGDPHQAIYGFTGADADSLDIIKREFVCSELPLTITYRCPKKVVSLAQNWVSHIQAAETAPEGQVSTVTAGTFKQQHRNISPTSAILCRNTAPLVGIALDLIKQRIACHVEGRDIGKGLILLTQRWRVDNLAEYIDKLKEWSDEQYQKLYAKKKEREAETLMDKVETIRVIARTIPGQGTSVADLQRVIRDIFADTPEGKPAEHITLSTIHKAKGREWPTVYLYGRNAYMPSRYAKQAWELEQENNLIYVAVTRAKERLIEVTVDV